MIKKQFPKQKRIVEIDIQITSIKTYKNFKKEFPDFSYDKKTKTYKLPKRIERDIIIPKAKIKGVRKEKVITISRDRKPKELPKKRYRIQAGKNYRSDNPPYFCYIRAITINPTITENGLKLAIEKTKKLYELDSGLNWDALTEDFDYDYTGLEPPTELGSYEDLYLNDYFVHTEVFIAYKEGSRNLIMRYTIKNI